MLEQAEDSEISNDRPDDIGLKSSALLDTSLINTPDSELEPLFEQLRRSLESMQGNHAQVEGVSEAVRQAQVALDDVLFKHAGAQQYDAL